MQRSMTTGYPEPGPRFFQFLGPIKAKHTGILQLLKIFNNIDCVTPHQQDETVIQGSHKVDWEKRVENQYNYSEMVRMLLEGLKKRYLK